MFGSDTHAEVLEEVVLVVLSRIEISGTGFAELEASRVDDAARRVSMSHNPKSLKTHDRAGNNQVKDMAFSLNAEEVDSSIWLRSDCRPIAVPPNGL